MYIVVTPQEGEHFTEFYILGPGGKAADYPTELIEGEEGEVIVGVSNHEWETMEYRMEMSFENQILENYRFELGHRDNWVKMVSFKPSITGENLKLQFSLFRNDNESVYRELHLWIDVMDIS